MKKFFALSLVLLLVCTGAAFGEEPANWNKFWDKSFQLEIGEWNPKNSTNHQTWMEGDSIGKKFAVDLLPVDWDETTPIKVYSPVDGTIACMNLFDAVEEGSTNGTSCQRGHPLSGTAYGAYGQHVRIIPDDSYGGSEYEFIIAHLQRNTEGLEIKAGDTRVRKGELIGYLGNTGYSQPAGVYHIHFELNKQSTSSNISVIGLTRDEISSTGNKYYGEFPEGSDTPPVNNDSQNIAGTYDVTSGTSEHPGHADTGTAQSGSLTIGVTDTSPNKDMLSPEGVVEFSNETYLSLGGRDINFTRTSNSDGSTSWKGVTPHFIVWIWTILPIVAKAEIEITLSANGAMHLVLTERTFFNIVLGKLNLNFNKSSSSSSSSSSLIKSSGLKEIKRNGLFKTGK